MLILLLILTLLSPIEVNAAEIIVDENSWHTVEESEPEQPDLSDDLEYYNGNIAEYRVVDGQMQRVINRKTRSIGSSPINGVYSSEVIDGVTHWYLSDTNCAAGTDKYDDGIIHYPIGYKVLTPHYCQNEYSGDWLDIRYYQFDNGLTWVCLMPEYQLNWNCYKNMNVIDIDINSITDLHFINLDSPFRIEVDGINTPIFRGCSTESVQVEAGCYILPDYAFEGCENLVTANLEGVTNLPDFCFENCPILYEIWCSMVTNMGNSCFENCYELYSIEASTTHNVGNNCFKNCTNLHEVDLHYADNLGDSSFENCSSLIKLDLYSVSSVGDRAFYNVASLGTTPEFCMINLSDVTSIGNQAFWVSEDTVIEGQTAPLKQSGIKTYFRDDSILRKAFDYDWAGDNRCIYWHDAEPEIEYASYIKETVLEPDRSYVNYFSVLCKGKFWEYNALNDYWKLKSGNHYSCNRYDCDIKCKKVADGSYILHVSGEVPGDQHHCAFESDLLVSLSTCNHENTHVESTAWCCSSGVESVICDDCHNVISRKDVPAMGHEYPDEWTIIRQATNTTCGIKIKKCIHGDKCDQRSCECEPHTIREPIPLIGSDIEYTPADIVQPDATMREEALNSMTDSATGIKLCDFKPSYKQVADFEWEFVINGELLNSNDATLIYSDRSANRNIVLIVLFGDKYCFCVETDYSNDDYLAFSHIQSLPNYGSTHYIEDVNSCIYFVNKVLGYSPRGRFPVPKNCKNALIMSDADFIVGQFGQTPIENVYAPNMSVNRAIPDSCFYNCPYLKNIWINTGFSEVGYNALRDTPNLNHIDTTHIHFISGSGMSNLGALSDLDTIYLPEIEILSSQSLSSPKIKHIILNDTLLEISPYCTVGGSLIEDITPKLSSLISVSNGGLCYNYVLKDFDAPNLVSIDYSAFYMAYALGSSPDTPLCFGQHINYVAPSSLSTGRDGEDKTFLKYEVSDTFMKYDWKNSHRAIEWCDDVRPVLVNDPFFYDTEEAESSVQYVDVHCTGARIVDHKQIVGIPISTVIDDGSYTLTADTEDNIDYTLTATGDLHDHDYTATGLTTKVADWTTNALEVHPNPITGPEDDVVSEYMEDAIVTCHIEALDGTNEDKGVAIPVQGLTGATTPIQYGEYVQEFEYNGVKATATVIGTCIHRETEDVTTPSKCVGKGKVETTCKQCGEVISTKDIDPVGHAMPDTWTVIQEPTVDVFGLKVKVCKRGDDCDERTADNAPFTLYGVIPKLDKPAEEKLVKILINPDDITCDEGDKLIDHVKKVILVYEVTETDGTKHERQEEVLPSDIPGLDKELATYGRDTLDITIGDVTGSAKVTVNCLHKKTEITSTEATCTHGGFTNMVCAQCGYDFHVDEAIAPLGHDMPDEWTTVKIPTDTEKGLKKKVCKRGDACDERMDDGSPYTVFEDIPMLNDMTHTVHYYGEWEVVKEATCTADGLKEKKCDDPTCDNVLQEPIQKLGHDMADGVHIVQDDKGYTLHKCKRNDYEYKIPDITVKVKLKGDDSSKTKGKKVTLAGKEETTNDSGEATFTLVPEGSQELEVTDAGTVKFNVTKDGAKSIKKKAKNDATISTSFKDETLTVNVNLDKKKEENKDDNKKKEESSQTQTSSSVQQKQEQPVTNINDMLNWIQNTTGLPSVLPQTGQDNVSGNDKQVIIGGLPVNKSTLLFGVVILCGVVIFLIKRKR